MAVSTAIPRAESPSGDPWRPAEVAGADEDDHLVEVIPAVDAVVDAEPRVAEVRRQRLREAVPTVVEETGVEGEGASDAAFDQVDRDGPIEEESQMEELELERQSLFAPDRPGRFEADVAMLVVIEIQQEVGHAALGRPIGLLRKGAGESPHRLEIEGGLVGGGRRRSREQRGAEQPDRPASSPAANAAANASWRRGVFETRAGAAKGLASDLDHDCNPRPCGHAVTVPERRLPRTPIEILQNSGARKIRGFRSTRSAQLRSAGCKTHHAAELLQGEARDCNVQSWRYGRPPGRTRWRRRRP
jgi:hypothetical protein